MLWKRVGQGVGKHLSPWATAAWGGFQRTWEGPRKERAESGKFAAVHGWGLRVQCEEGLPGPLGKAQSPIPTSGYCPHSSFSFGAQLGYEVWAGRTDQPGQAAKVRVTAEKFAGEKAKAVHTQ